MGNRVNPHGSCPRSNKAFGLLRVGGLFAAGEGFHESDAPVLGIDGPGPGSIEGRLTVDPRTAYFEATESIAFMRNSPIPKQTVGRTFIVAISVLGLVACLQVGAIAYAFVHRWVTSPAPEKLAQVPDETAAPEGSAEIEPAGDKPAEPVSEPTPLPPPGTIAGKVLPSAEARINELVDQAKKQRERQNMEGALAKLREAQIINQNHPLVVLEMAMTYEMMGLSEKAVEQWKRVFEMGSAAGSLYHLAEMKLQGTPTEAPEDPELPTRLPAIDPNLVGKDSEGLQPGSTLGLIEIRTVEEEDPAAVKNFKLGIAIKARPEEPIDVRDVVIQVFFYDMLENERVVQTNAKVSSNWTTAPADWSEGGIEILEVGYTQPLPELEEERETRKYLGYIVRVYYKNELQDVRAEPASLLTLFPPPLEVQTD